MCLNNNILLLSKLAVVSYLNFIVECSSAIFWLNPDKQEHKRSVKNTIIPLDHGNRTLEVKTCDISSDSEIIHLP